MIVTLVEEVTAFVVTVNVAVVFPAATLTVAGTLAAALLLDSEMEMPPAGAAALKVTVPVEGSPPVRLVGVSDTALRVTAGVMVRGAVTFALL